MQNHRGVRMRGFTPLLISIPGALTAFRHIAGTRTGNWFQDCWTASEALLLGGNGGRQAGIRRGQG